MKDYIAYLRIIANTKDEEGLKRIINYPARGIGKTTMEKCLVMAGEQNITFFEVLEKAKGFGFKAGTLTAIEEFVTMIKYFQNQLTKHNAYDVAVQVGKTFVLPLPAPAIIIKGPLICNTASNCFSFKPFKYAACMLRRYGLDPSLY